jgi:hypothetical protein
MITDDALLMYAEYRCPHCQHFNPARLRLGTSTTLQQPSPLTSTRFVAGSGGRLDDVSNLDRQRSRSVVGIMQNSGSVDLTDDRGVETVEQEEEGISSDGGLRRRSRNTSGNDSVRKTIGNRGQPIERRIEDHAEASRAEESGGEEEEEERDEAMDETE